MNIKELAKQAGELVSLHDGGFALFGNETIERFAKLVAAAEREACAQLVEEVGRQTAAAIRARGEK